MLSIYEKQKIEVDHWKNSESESPESDSALNIIQKVSESAVLLDCLQRFKSDIPEKGRVLELGAGQGWASAFFKKLYPGNYMVVTDISEYAVASIPKWENLWGVKIDASYACKCHETREADSTLDFVFCYAAAHHFLEHKKALREIARILKPGAKCFYFHEPACPSFWHPMAHWRVNRKRPSVPEDVLILSRIKTLAEEAGLEFRVNYYPTLLQRGPKELLYYYALNLFPPLQKIFPCTVNFIFQKPSSKIPGSALKS